MTWILLLIFLNRIIFFVVKVAKVCTILHILSKSIQKKVTRHFFYSFVSAGMPPLNKRRQRNLAVFLWVD